MGKSIPNVKFELANVYKTYVDQILLSSSISDILLDNTNIDSAGEQIEGGIRILLKDLLPDRVFTTHGYMVDKQSNISYQQDILLAESFYTKSLIKSLDGTEFYPVESIFASGEVKKTWSQKKLLGAIKSISRSKNDLKKYLIPSNVISSGSRFIQASHEITENKYRNPLFTFTFSIDFDKTYNEKRFNEIYLNKNEWKNIPNISVILRQGIVVCVEKEKLKMDELSIKLYPEFIKDKDKYTWVFLKLRAEQNLAYLVFMLTQHINDSILEKVSAMDYAKSMIEISQSSIQPIK